MQSRFLFKLGQLLQEHFASAATTPATPSAASAAASVDPPVSLAQLNKLRSCLEVRREEFRKKSVRNKVWAAVFEIATVALSVATPVVLGWQGITENGPVKHNLTNLALVLSALTAGATTLTGFFDHKELWVQYKMARNELDTILTKLDMLAADEQPAITTAQLAQLFTRYEQVCTETDAFYRKTRLAPNRPVPPIK